MIWIFASVVLVLAVLHEGFRTIVKRLSIALIILFLCLLVWSAHEDQKRIEAQQVACQNQPHVGDTTPDGWVWVQVGHDPHCDNKDGK